MLSHSFSHSALHSVFYIWHLLKYNKSCTNVWIKHKACCYNINILIKTSTQCISQPSQSPKSFCTACLHLLLCHALTLFYIISGLDYFNICSEKEVKKIRLDEIIINPRSTQYNHFKILNKKMSSTCSFYVTTDATIILFSCSLVVHNLKACLLWRAVR